MTAAPDINQVVLRGLSASCLTDHELREWWALRQGVFGEAAWEVSDFTQALTRMRRDGLVYVARDKHCMYDGHGAAGWSLTPFGNETERQQARDGFYWEVDA